MAKLRGSHKFSGTWDDMTNVNSRAYGAHLRKARTTFKLADGMKASSEILKAANIYAKVFKDAIDPFRVNFRDGQLWQRLVSLFKVQIREEGKPDFGILYDQDLNHEYYLGSIIDADALVTESDDKLKVSVTSRLNQDPTNGTADGYQLTCIVIFIDKALVVQKFSSDAIIPFDVATVAQDMSLSIAERTIISVQRAPGVQDVSLSIPEGSATAIVVVKCNFSKGQKPLGQKRGMGMKVLDVVEFGSGGEIISSQRHREQLDED